MNKTTINRDKIAKYLKGGILVFFALSCLTITGQTQSSGTVKWRTRPFDHRIFIANAGQDNGAVPGKVLFHVLFGEIDAYFTPSGIIYRYDEYPKNHEGENPEDAEEAGGETVNPVIHYLSSTWVGSNPSVTVDTLQPQSYYYAYTLGVPGSPEMKNIRVRVYKEIIYRNIYPGIDADYTFPDDPDIHRGILKYALIVHPGANLAQVKLAYTGDTLIRLDEEGNVLVSSIMGTCTDHTPISYILDASGQKENEVETSYRIAGNIETFSLSGAYDQSKTLVVDPAITWTTDPLFTGAYDNALDVDYDNVGNVYAYGGTFKYQLVMLNSLGAIQWYWNNRMPKEPIALPETCLGNLAVDRSTGNSYVSAGFIDTVWKINNAGALLGFYKDSDANTNTGVEAWKLLYNPGQSAIVEGVGGKKQIYQFSTATPLTIPHGAGALTMGPASTGDDAFGCCHDIVMMCMDPSWNFAYIVSGSSVQDSLSKAPLPTLTPYTWTLHTATVAFPEFMNNNTYYTGGEAQFVNEFNGMAASRQALYLYDGGKISRVSEANGAVQGSLVVAAKKYRSGGLTVDHCDNLYAGVGPVVNIYDGLTLTANGTINMAVNTDTIYDLKLGKDSNTTLYASGMGFIASIAINPSPPCTVVLPVNLLYFNCSPQSGSIELDWSTATETNNKYFTIERSPDGANFSALTVVDGAGNSSIKKLYEYIDESPLLGNNYYRLSQTDYDGHTSYIGTTVCNSDNTALLVSPNPSAGKFAITLPSCCFLNLVNFTVYDMLGREVYSADFQGQQTINLDLHEFASGLYVLNVKTEEKSFVAKILINK